jgi:hypothetical protein
MSIGRSRTWRGLIQKYILGLNAYPHTCSWITFVWNHIAFDKRVISLLSKSVWLHWQRECQPTEHLPIWERKGAIARAIVRVIYKCLFNWLQYIHIIMRIHISVTMIQHQAGLTVATMSWVWFHLQDALYYLIQYIADWGNLLHLFISRRMGQAMRWLVGPDLHTYWESWHTFSAKWSDPITGVWLKYFL